MTAVADTTSRRPWPVAVLVSIALAWVAVIGLFATGNNRVVDHDALLGDGRLPSLVAVGEFAAAWVVMAVAMMLPSAVPTIRLFVAISAPQPRARAARAAFIGAYLLMWTLFGWFALVFDASVHRTVDAWPWLDAHQGLVEAGVLGVAGVFQFSRLKDTCLRSCRHPAAYLIPRYRRGAAAAFGVGWRHAVFCLGCCWALMLVAFALGMTDLALMAAFTALMSYEKIGGHGEVVARAAGIALLGAALAVAAAAVS
jgi:predicted metal-binding membrane protein